MATNAVLGGAFNGLAALQRVQLQRSAEAARSRAESLASQAVLAQREADASQRRADSLGSQAGVARERADQMTQTERSAQAFDRLGAAVGAQVGRVAQQALLQPAETVFDQRGRLRPVSDAVPGRLLSVTA